MEKILLIDYFFCQGETMNAEDASNLEKSDPVIDDALDDEGDFGNDLDEQQLEDEGDDSMADPNTLEALGKFDLEYFCYKTATG